MEYELRVVRDKGPLVSTWWESPVAALTALAHDTAVDGQFNWHRASCVWHHDGKHIQQWVLDID